MSFIIISTLRQPPPFALITIMPECDKCYKRIYGSFADHEAYCQATVKQSEAASSSYSRNTTSRNITSDSFQSPNFSSSGSAAHDPPSASPLLHLTASSAYTYSNDFTTSTFKKRKGTSQEVIQGDVIPPDINKSTASTRIYDTEGLTGSDFANCDSTNKLLSNPFYYNASEETRRSMMSRHSIQLSSLKTTGESPAISGQTLNHIDEGFSKNSSLNNSKSASSKDRQDVDFTNDRRSLETRLSCDSPQFNGNIGTSHLDDISNHEETFDFDEPGSADTAAGINATNTQPPLPPVIQTIIETMRMQSESNGVLFGPKELASLELHSILDKANVPKYLFDQIAAWGFKNDLRKSGLLNRSQMINHMKIKMQMPDIYPKRIFVRVDENNFEVMTKFDFKNNMYSLLSDPELMRPENLIFGDNPLEPPVFEPGDDEPLGDIDSCQWYYDTYKKMVKNPLMQMLCPIIIFEDETYQDTKGALKFHLITFTLGIFNRETRARPEAWRHLGFIPKAKNRQPEGTQVKDTSRRKCMDHHIFISEILAGFKEAQAEQPLPWQFGETKVEMFIPLMYSIGDIAGQDKLCGRYSAHTKMQSAMRDCDVEWVDADDKNHHCSFLNMHIIQDLSTTGGKDETGTSNEETNRIKDARSTLKKMSFHYGVDNAFSDIDFGANDNGINAATPPCISHSFKMRFSGDASSGYLDLFGSSDVTQTKIIIESTIPRFIHQTYRQSSRDYPKIYNFRNKIVKGKVLTHGELLAQTFALYLFSLTSFAKSTAIALSKATEHNEFSLLLERTLTIYSFLYQSSFPKVLAKPTEAGRFNALGDEQLVKYHDLYCKLLANPTKSNTRSPKLHTLFHWMSYIYRYGSTKNFEGSSCDSNFKENIKRHAKRSQRRPDSVHMQTGTNFCDAVILKKALWFAKIGTINSDDDGSSVEGEGVDDVLYDGEIVSSGNFRISKKSGRFFLKRQTTQEHNKLVWAKNQVDPTRPFNNVVLRQIFSFLFNSQTGTVAGTKSIPCFTCLKHIITGDLFRAHPCYRSGDPWFDHVYVKWDASYKACPARIEMFLDLTKCEFGALSQLKKELYAVVTSIVDARTNRGSPTTAAKNKLKLRNSSIDDLKLCTIWEVENQLRFIPVSTIQSGCFCFPDFTDENMSTNTFWIEIKARNEWHEHHNYVAPNPYTR